MSVYDSLGNRVATKFNDVWQFVIYDAFGKLIAEYGGMQSSDEGGVRYILSDWQGSVRGVLNNAGFVQSRTDYTSFGEEINSGVGLRTTAQGFGVSNQTRQGYGLTEKDETGLNHTWFRKNENRAGRWTSPDPYNGSISLGNPQSFNRYSYVENEPTNYVDPSGLQIMQVCGWTTYAGVTYTTPDGETISLPVIRIYQCTIIFISNGGNPPSNPPNPPTEGGGGDSPTSTSTLTSNPSNDVSQQKDYDNCVSVAWSEFRKIYIKDGGKTLLGGSLIIIGILGVRWGFRTGRQTANHDMLGALDAPKAAGQASLGPIGLGGMLLYDVFTRNEAARRDEKISECKRKFPRAKH